MLKRLHLWYMPQNINNVALFDFDGNTLQTFIWDVSRSMRRTSHYLFQDMCTKNLNWYRVRNLIWQVSIVRHRSHPLIVPIFIPHVPNFDRVVANQSSFETSPYWHMPRCRNVVVRRIITDMSGRLRTFFWYTSTCTRLILKKLNGHLSYCTNFLETRVNIDTCRRLPNFLWYKSALYRHVTPITNILLKHVHVYPCHTIKNLNWQLSYCTKFPGTHLNIERCHGSRNVLWYTSTCTCVIL